MEWKYRIPLLFQWLNTDDQGHRPRISIPTTLVFRHGVIRNWYFTSIKDGTVRRKKRANLRKSLLAEEFCKGVGPEDAVASFLFYERDNRAEEISSTMLTHLTAAELQNMMTHPLEDQKEGVLQKWVAPKGTRNSVIHCTWAPLLLQLEKRTTVKNLNDRCDLYDRVVTFEGSSHDSDINNVNSTLIRGQIKAICDTIAAHVVKVSEFPISLYQMTLYFKVGEDSKVWLLWCSSMLAAKKSISPSMSSKPTAYRPNGRSNSPALSVPLYTEYSRKMKSAVLNVPVCAVCGKTVGVPISPGMESKTEAANVDDEANAANSTEMNAPHHPFHAVSPQPTQVTNLLDTSAILAFGSSYGPNSNVLGSVSHRNYADAAAPNNNNNNNSSNILNNNNNNGINVRAKPLHSQKSGGDDYGAWELTYETVIRHHHFLLTSQQKRKARLQEQEEQEDGQERRQRKMAKNRARGYKKPKRNNNNNAENGITEEDDDDEDDDGDDDDYDGDDDSCLSTIVNIDTDTALTDNNNAVPLLLKKMEPWLTPENFVFECRKPEFLQRTMQVCEVCYCRYTTSAAAAVAEGAMAMQMLSVDDRDSKRSKRVVQRLTKPLESYPEDLLPDYCSIRTYEALKHHANRHVTGETMRRKQKIWSMIGDDVPPPLPLPQGQQQQQQQQQQPSASASTTPRNVHKTITADTKKAIEAAVESSRYVAQPPSAPLPQHRRSRRGGAETSRSSSTSLEIQRLLEFKKKYTKSVWDESADDPMIGVARTVMSNKKKVANGLGNANNINNSSSNNNMNEIYGYSYADIAAVHESGAITAREKTSLPYNPLLEEVHIMDTHNSGDEGKPLQLPPI